MKRLLEEKRWGVWAWGQRSNKAGETYWTKVPFTGYNVPGKPDTPEMWQRYADMQALYEKYRRPEEHMVNWHDEALAVGDTYTDADLKKASEVASAGAWRKFKTTNRYWLRPMLEAERAEEEGVFRKTGEWYAV